MRKYSAAAQLILLLFLPATGLCYDLEFGERNYGKPNGQVKVIHVLQGEDNGYDPTNGTSYLAKLKYLTPDLSGFKAAAGFYVNGDLFGLTDWDSEDEKVGRGMFVDDEGDDTTQLGEIYAE